jgi:hypothetical protein
MAHPPRRSARLRRRASLCRLQRFPKGGSRAPSGTIPVCRLPTSTWPSSAWHTLDRATRRAGTDSRGYQSARIVFAPPPSSMWPSNGTASSSGRVSPPE